MHKIITAIIAIGIVLTLTQSIPVQASTQNTSLTDESAKVAKNEVEPKKILTSRMSVKKKKAIIKDLMIKYGYHKDDISLIIYSINWKNVTDDFPPSFYTALERGYLDKYHDNYTLSKYSTDEKVMSDINKIVELMIKHGYTVNQIWKTVYKKSQPKNVTDDFAPSFYTALERGYLDKYIDQFDLAEYYTDEKTMSNINKLIELMIKYYYNKERIHNIIENIEWKNVTDDFAPSFYTAIEKGYIEKYIKVRKLDKCITDEKKMTDANRIVELMLKAGYNANEIIYNIDSNLLENYTDEYLEMLSKYKGLIFAYASRYKKNKTYRDSVNKLVKSNKTEKEIKDLMELLNCSYPDSDAMNAVQLVYSIPELDQFDKKEIISKIKTDKRYYKITNQSQYTDKEKIDRLKKLDKKDEIIRGLKYNIEGTLEILFYPLLGPNPF